MRLLDLGIDERIAESEETFPNVGTFRRYRIAFGERVVDISKFEREVSETQQTLVADRLGLEHSYKGQEGGTYTRRFCG